MSKFDLINGLIMRMNSNGDKKSAKRLYKELQKKIDDIKTEEDDDLFFSDFDQLIVSPYIRPFIVNDFFKERIGVAYALISSFSNDFKYEMRWMIKSVEVAKDIINDFIQLREKYDNCVLKNEFDEALSIVREVEEKYGESYWIIQCKSYLQKEIETYDEKLTEGLSDNVYGFAIHFFEYLSRESITSDEYGYLVKKYIDDAREYEGNNQSGVEFLYYIVSGNFYVFSEDNILEVIKCIQNCSIIDRYLFVIWLADELVASNNSAMRMILAGLIGNLSAINDDHLYALIFAYSNKHLIDKEFVLKSRLSTAKKAFVAGELVEAKNQILGFLNNFPNNTEAMRLYAEILILLGEEDNEYVDTNLGKIISCLQSVYSLDESKTDIVEETSKILLMCSMSTWSRHLNSEVMRTYSQMVGDDYDYHNIIANLQHLSVETIIAAKPSNESVEYIEKYYDISDDYVSFRIAELNGDYARASELCGVPSWKEYFYICDNHTIENKMAHLLPVSGKDVIFAVKAVVRFLSDMDVDKHASIFLKKSAELVVDNIYTSLILPWDKLIRYIDDGPSEIRQEIYVPILYYVYCYHIKKAGFDDLGIVCDDFFRFNGISRPSKMEMFNNRYDHKMLVYFLRKVCSAKTLDDSLDIFVNTSERDKERVEICNLLTHIDPENTKIYENEIRELTQKLMINKELTIIDESRIHVNSDGIKEKLCNAGGMTNRFGGSIKNDYQRYLFYKEEGVNYWLQAIQGGNADKIEDIFKETNRLFRELILKIRDAFVSSDEYGLNGYLSLNIRHNTLEDEMRGPLHRTNLYVKKGLDSTYQYSHDWMINVSSRDRDILQKAFGNLYVSTESILSKLKNEYIQIRTEQKNENALFDYRLYESDLDILSTQIQEKSFDEFYDIVINYFWAITEENLLKVKRVLKGEIYKEYVNVFERLRSEVRDISNLNVSRKIQQKAREAETDMFNTLEKISYWFQRSSESKHNDFDLQFAFDLGLQTIVYMHPEKNIIATKLEPTYSDKIQGQYLKEYDGLFYNILDNVYKKASPNQRDGAIEIRYKLHYSKEGTLNIYIENDFDCTGNIQNDIDKVEEAKRLIASGDYLSKVKGEGGTGIPKICKILKVDLKLNPQMDFGYKLEENKFFMNITI